MRRPTKVLALLLYVLREGERELVEGGRELVEEGDKKKGGSPGRCSFSIPSTGNGCCPLRCESLRSGTPHRVSRVDRYCRYFQMIKASCRAAGTNGAKIHTTEKATSPIHEQVYLTQMETNKLFSGICRH